MAWQDLVIGGCQFLFALAVVPSILDRATVVPRSTSAFTAALLFVLAGTFATLGLDVSMLGSVACGGAWTLLVLLRGPKADGRRPFDLKFRLTSPRLP